MQAHCDWAAQLCFNCSSAAAIKQSYLQSAKEYVQLDLMQVKLKWKKLFAWSGIGSYIQIQ